MIRQAEPKDESAIAELWQVMVDYHRELDPLLFRAAEDGARRYAASVCERLDDPWSRVLVAEVDGAVVGYAYGMIADITTEFYQPTRSGLLLDVCVSASQRRRGIGTELVEAMRHWFVECEVERFEWHVSAGNEAALQFWQSIGGRATILRMRADCRSET